MASVILQLRDWGEREWPGGVILPRAAAGRRDAGRPLALVLNCGDGILGQVNAGGRRYAAPDVRYWGNSGHNSAEGTQCAVQTLLHWESNMRFLFISVATATTLFFMLAASAETPEERQACEIDAFRVCGAFIPDRDKVFACMANNQDQLSAPCRQVMARYSHPNRRRAESASHSQTTNSSSSGFGASVC